MKHSVIVTDQFWGPSPASIQQTPLAWEEMLQYAKEHMLLENAQRAAKRIVWRPTEILEVEDNFVPPMCSTVYRKTAGGMTEVWKMRWDSSG